MEKEVPLREGKGDKKRRWEEGKGDSQYTTALLGEMGKGGRGEIK